MAKGDVSYMLSDFRADRTGVSTVTFSGNATKLIEDEDGSKQSIGSWVGTVTYPKAGLGTKTLAEVNTDLITEIKSKNAAVASKTIV